MFTDFEFCHILLFPRFHEDEGPYPLRSAEHSREDILKPHPKVMGTENSTDGVSEAALLQNLKFPHILNEVW